MKFFSSFGVVWALIILFSVVTLGQQLPACAGHCLDTSLKALDTCNATDVSCICTNQILIGAVQKCVLSSCTVKEALNAQNSTQTMCGETARDISQITPIITGVSGSLALLGVLIRCLSTGGNFALDDAFAITAMVAALPMGILEFFLAEDGFGRDIWTIPAANIYRIILFTWLTEVFYHVAIASTKMSFLCFCLRIFPRKELRTTVYILLGICVAYGTAFTIGCIFNCTPVSFIWTGWDGEHSGRCINMHVFTWVHAGINITLDMVIISVPTPELLRLSLSTKKKIQVVMMFSVSAFTTVVSIVRLRSLVQFATSTNQTYDNVPTAYWSILEVYVGIFCVCMPALRRFISRALPRCFGPTQANLKSDPSATPNKLSYMMRERSKGRVSGGSTAAQCFGIMKTTDTRVESKAEEDDEIQLVQLWTDEHWDKNRVSADSKSHMDRT